jgi:hypothetical protein
MSVPAAPLGDVGECQDPAGDPRPCVARTISLAPSMNPDMTTTPPADTRHQEASRIIVLCGEPPGGRSPLAVGIVTLARTVDANAYVTMDPDDLLGATTTALQSAGALLLVIDPEVRQPVDIARRVTRNWPQVWILLALTGERLAQTRRMTDRAEPTTSR